MGQNQFSNHPEWSLVEDIARIVYKNDIKLLTKADIKEIEESIDNGTLLSLKDSGVGEMNIETGVILGSVSIGFAVIQIILAYLAWRYPYDSTKSDDTTDQDQNAGFKAIGPHQINEAIKDISDDPGTPDPMKEELKKHGGAISSAIATIMQKLKSQRNKEDSSNK